MTKSQKISCLSLIITLFAFGTHSCTKKSKSNSGGNGAVNCTTLRQTDCGLKEECMWNPNGQCTAYTDINSCAQLTDQITCSNRVGCQYSLVSNRCRSTYSNLGSTQCAQYTNATTCNQNLACTWPIGAFSCTAKAIDNCSNLLNAQCATTPGCSWNTTYNRCMMVSTATTPFNCSQYNANPSLCGQYSVQCSYNSQSQQCINR